MTICNACRYCEGFCAVFPAMELRRKFTSGDLWYLANLCHDCRGCYYACQYAPPHEFAVNVPQTFAELRMESYRDFSWPAALRGLFRNNSAKLSVTVVLSLIVVLLLALLFGGGGDLFSSHVGEGAFYQVIPYAAMVLPFSALAIFVVFGLWRGVRNLWRESAGDSPPRWKWQPLLAAMWDVVVLRHLDGGGHGCNYPDDRFRMIRRYAHHAVFYGFLLCLASTTVAAAYEHLLHRVAPYPFWSWPVMLGTVGGIALLAGTALLLYLRMRMDRDPAYPGEFGMDVGFTVLLFSTSLTGLLLLALRETAAMGSLLVVHLALVAGLFITMPYGKFVHAVYRYAALVRYAAERGRAER
jgi:citrate/tricarballylate utilization protein